MKIVLDPGHGGSDPGAVANGLQEKDVNLLVSNYLGQLLSNAGYQVAATRTTDQSVSLIRRSQIAAEQNADLFISIHVNSGGGNGTETYYSITDPDPALAISITDNIASLGFRNRGAKTRRGSNGDYYSVIRETVRLSRARPYLVEMFFIDSTADVATYTRVGYQAMATAIFNAVLKDFPLAPSNGNQVYVVQRGDTLFSIAQQFNTTVAAIKSLNNLTSDVLTIGQQLLIPGGSQAPEVFVYTVQSGDTLYSIAQRFGTTVATIRSLNNLTSDQLYIGQQLWIPTNAQVPETFIYTVQRGDTLFSIAQRFGTTVAMIRSLNNLTSDVLTIGQQLLIPGSSQGPGTFIYTVVRGDTLFSIAQRFGTTVTVIRTLNNLTSDVLTIGQQLQIPG